MNRRRAIVLVAGAAILFGAAGRAQEEDLSSPALRIEWDEFKKLYDRRELVLIDVRPAESFEMGHIPGARSIPLEDVEKRAAALKKEKKLVVPYCACAADHTSARAALTLQKKGLNARALAGGLNRWLKEIGRVDRGKGR